MPPATISEWTWPEKPWHRLHLDLADNGRQFVSGEFEQFTKMNGIRHTKTSPYNPSTNGLAERYVRKFKNLLRKNNGKDDLETNLQSFLFAHRAFPQTVIKEFPCGTANEEKFKIKILEFNTKMANPREEFHEAVRRQEQFTTGCEVYFRNYATGPKRRQDLPEPLSVQYRDRNYVVTLERRQDGLSVVLHVMPEDPALQVRGPLDDGVLDRLRFLPIKKMDQRTCIKFYVKNEIKCAVAFRMLTVAYGEPTLDRSNVYRWYKMFSEGREDVNDQERAGRPSTSTTDEKINEVEKMILANRRITVREVAEDLNISIGSCHSIFINDLGMRRVAAKFVPKLLNCDQKQHRMNIANEMLDSVRDDPNLLQRVITGDEAWVYGYDVETKAQSSQWKLPHEPRPKKARQVRSNVKVLLTVFFDCRGVVHHEFLPQGRTVNKEYYLQVMRNLREAIRQKRPDLWKNKNWLLHHDNAPAHTSLLVRDFLAKTNTLMMPQPPYSPDLAPCDFFLFPKLKRPMKGRRYATLDEIKTASKEELKKIFKNDFLKCFEDWKNRWHKCIISHGDYFEGDKIEAVESLKFLQVTVPGAVPLGAPVILACQFVLDPDEELYSAKWSKDQVEFYRFLPRDRPPGHAYPMAGVPLDMLLYHVVEVGLHYWTVQLEREIVQRKLCEEEPTVVLSCGSGQAWSCAVVGGS
ncbi:hypothetical protein LAZ67_2000633 [Cordylochernes scorpioides]|uniref:Integrase catalytic domain-containing protein n=1 Tax=Cordylochernes scorpioides TaxID=51811 RepID=A0ABY6K3T5_9ARAC|nr:hypothetical protein LAZ67_2000633 [Cordylochernes scorpioides]